MVEELPFKQRVAGSTPAIPRKIRGVAQRLEQLPDTQPVEGSIPSAPTSPVQNTAGAVFRARCNGCIPDLGSGGRRFNSCRPDCRKL